MRKKNRSSALIRIDEELLAQVKKIRHQDEIETQVDCISDLLRMGIEARAAKLAERQAGGA